MNQYKRAQLASFAAETLGVLEKGEYASKDGTKVFIGGLVENCVSNTIHFSPKKLKELRKNLHLDKSEEETVFEVTNETSLEASYRLVVEEKNPNTICLNFASAKNPGGGFQKGSSAQEESLVRSSALYTSLVSKRENFYDINMYTKGGVYTDNLIWSPSVPVFRTDTGIFLTVPYLLHFISTPAMNVGAEIIHFNNASCNLAEEVMQRRIDNVLAIAALNKASTVILGAWGCGVFKNIPEHVANYFASHLTEPNAKYRNVFKKVVFAILATNTAAGQRSWRAFKTVFEN